MDKKICLDTDWSLATFNKKHFSRIRDLELLNF